MEIKIIIILTTIIIIINSATIIQNVVTDVVYSLADPPEDGRLNFTGLATKYGLPVQEYKIVTEDNYILTIFNVPAKGECVLLMHGFLDSADTFMIRGNTSLVYFLSKAGFNVWVGNYRGNKYSRHHVVFSPDKDKQYWNFSYHEIGCYDMPATIDFILDKCGQTQLRVVGHSEGNTIFFVLAATRPEYNAKIKMLIALAPICHLQHIKPPILFIAKAAPPLNAGAAVLQQEEVFSNHSEAKALLTLICTQQLTSETVCAQIGYRAFGFEPDQLETEFIRILMAHYPAGSSRKNANHMAQMYSIEEFGEYDYLTEWGNREVYGVSSSPKYNLSCVTMDLIFYLAKGDRLSVEEDVVRLKGQVGSRVRERMMPRETFNHGDYLWGKSSYKDVYPLIKEDLE